MKKLKFWALITFGALLTLQSCVRENLEEKTLLPEKSANENVAVGSRTETEEIFRQSLQDLIELYDDANTTSTGALSTLLDSIGNAPQEDALEALDGSGLINMTLLESTIADAITYEALLIQEQSASYVDAVIAEETGTMQERGGRPFWGKKRVFIGIVGGMNPEDPCYEYYVVTKYRFWINFGSNDEYIRVPCE